MRIIHAIAVMFLAGALAGCPQPMPGPGSPGPSPLIDCSIASVRDHALVLIPRVNDCLTNRGDWKGCLIGLINPGAGIVEDVLACATKSSGTTFASSADANARDTVSAEGAARAEAFMKERGYQFKSPPPPN
jgi:hypothetical protein